MKSYGIVAIFLFIVSGSLLAEINKPVVVNIYAVGGTTEMASTKKVLKIFSEKHPNIKVKATRAPFTTDDVFQYYLQSIEAKSSDIDVMIIDCSWARSLSENLLDMSPYVTEARTKEYFPNIFSSYTVGKKIVALPWYSDAGLMYYRKDLLKKYNQPVPKTWTDLTKTAYIIQEGEKEAGNQDFVGYVWQGNAYEGLTCNAFEWIYSNDGGTIISADKKITIDNDNAVNALVLAAGWIGTISPRGVLGMNEDKSKDVFMSGNAAFIRSWPYLYSVMETKGSRVAGKFDLMPIPAGKGGKGAGVLGGWGVSINKYSKHPEAAAKVVLFLSSKEAQKLRAIESGNAPNIDSLYKDKEVLKANPEYTVIYKALLNGVNRPFVQSYPYYNQVSQAFYKSVYSVLQGKKDAGTALALLSKELHGITKFPVVKE